MNTYVLLSRLTDDGRKTILKKPERIRAVNHEVESMGGKIMTQYAVLGFYDFVTILEAQDDQTVARISLALGSRGTVEITSLPAISIDTFVQSVSQGKMAA